MDNRPVRIEQNVDAFRESPLNIKFRFPEGYQFGEMSVIFREDRQLYDLLVEPEIDGRVITIPVDQETVNQFPNRLDFYLREDGIAKIYGSIYTQMGGVAEDDSEGFFDIKDDLIIPVYISGLAQVADQVNITIENAAATSEDRMQTGIDRVATAQDRAQTSLDKETTSENAEQTASDRITTTADRLAVATDKSEIIVLHSEVVGDAAEVTLKASQVSNNLELTKEYRDDALSASTGILNPKGTFNASTGVATITETGATFSPTATSDQPNGVYFTIVVAGVSSVTGAPISMAIGGAIRSSGTKYAYIPPSDLALSIALQLSSYIEQNTRLDQLHPFVARDPVTGTEWELAYFNLLGEFIVSRFKQGSIPQAALGSLQLLLKDLGLEARQLMFKQLHPLTGYHWSVESDDDIPALFIGVRTNGNVFIPRLEVNLADGTITKAMLDAPTQKLLEAGGIVNTNDRVTSDDDGLVRGRYIDTDVVTCYNGALFTTFSRKITPVIQGVNNSGVSLDFRRSSGLLQRGKRYIGLFTPSSTTEGAFRGLTTVTPSITGAVNNDWWKVGTTPVATITINGQTARVGDIVIYNSGTPGNFTVKSGPTGAPTSERGDFWILPTGGTFAGVTYPSGSIMYLSGNQSATGRFYKHFLKGKDGEYFFLPFNPNNSSQVTALPTTSPNGLVLVAIASGSWNGFTLAKDDFIIRSTGSWRQYTPSPVTVVPNDGFFSFGCVHSDEWEVRRTDMSNTTAEVYAKGRNKFTQKDSIPNIVAYGNSMIGYVLPELEAYLAPRVVKLESYPSGNSEDISSMVEYNAMSGDPYKGWFMIFETGQNDGGKIALFSQHVTNLKNLGAANQNRFLFLSVLGDKKYIYSGGRIVTPAHEDNFNKVASNSIYRKQQILEQEVPGNYIDMYQIALAHSLTLTTTPDLLRPGKTIAQSALDGQISLTFFLNYASLAYPATEWVWAGYHSLNTAPTGGVDKQYYISTYELEGVTIQRMWLRVSGVWTAITWDDIHVTSAFPPVANAAIGNWLIANKQ